MMLTGNHAAAYGAKLARVEAIPVYPITPQTTVMEKLIEFISRKEMDAVYVPVESEHSVMAAAVGAQATGVRTFTASSSQGIAYMHENLFVASGLRLPIVMVAVNRCIGPPISIFPDHSDSLAQRDTAWLQIYVEDAQEVLDMVIQAYKIAENRKVLLPVAVCYEGLVVSHFLEPVEIPDQRRVDAFLPPYHPEHVILDPGRPMHLSVMVNEKYFMEYRYQQEEAMGRSKGVIQEVDQQFKEMFGRSYGGLLSTYMMEDAEIALVSMGSVCGLARVAIRELRKTGMKVGAVKLRAFRPFPGELLEQILNHLELVIVLDRAVSTGYGGILFPELASALYNRSVRPYVLDYIVGLGGRTMTVSELVTLVNQSVSQYKKGQLKQSIQWVGVRGLE